MRQIDSSWDRRRFRRFPAWLYRDDRYWVPPLPGQPAGCYPSGIPAACFLAEVTSMIGEDHVAGRMLVFADPTSNERHGENVAWFGFFEVVNHLDVAADLFELAETWVGDHVPGAKVLRGPASPYSLGGRGLLVDGFNGRPGAFTPYGAPYYPEFLGALGFEPVEESRTLRQDLEGATPGRGSNGAHCSILSDGITLRPGSANSFASQLAALAPLAVSQQDGFPGTPPTDQGRWTQTLASMANYLDPALCFWLERQGEPLGAILGLPDLNQAAGAARGWPFPLNQARLALARLRITQARAFQPMFAEKTGRAEIAEVLWGEVARAGAAAGYRSVEYGPIDAGSLSIEPLLALGARPAKRYLIYEKALS